MKSIDPNQDPLLEAVLAGEDFVDLRSRSLERMLLVARQSRRQRRFVRAVACGLIPILAAVALLALCQFTATAPSAASFQKPTMTSEKPAPATALSSTRANGVKILTDDELLAFFPERPVALIGPPGNRKFILLDEAARGWKRHPLSRDDKHPSGG